MWRVLQSQPSHTHGIEEFAAVIRHQQRSIALGHRGRFEWVAGRWIWADLTLRCLQRWRSFLLRYFEDFAFPAYIHAEPRDPPNDTYSWRSKRAEENWALLGRRPLVHIEQLQMADIEDARRQLYERHCENVLRELGSGFIEALARRSLLDA